MVGKRSEGGHLYKSPESKSQQRSEMMKGTIWMLSHMGGEVLRRECEGRQAEELRVGWGGGYRHHTQRLQQH